MVPGLHVNNSTDAYVTPMAMCEPPGHHLAA
jgi:hypothetical protein